MPSAALTPDADALLAWLAARGGTVRQRDIGDSAPRSMRKAAVYLPLVEELLAAGAIVETGARPRSFALAAPAAAPARSGSRLLDMLAEAAAELDDVPDGLVSYWAAVTVRDRLVASMRVRNGLPAECEVCAKAGHAVDRAVIEAFDCEVPE